jgi:endonuclease/exonuclease/phosphatase family metal-dependent hydrolase
MKIMYLNTWGGRVAEPLKKFFESNQDVDVFCLQEVWHDASFSVMDKDEQPDLFSQIGTVLDTYEKVFAPANERGDYGLAVYYKKSLLKISDDNLMIHDREEFFPDRNITSFKRNLQCITFQVEDCQKLTILNFHGLWTGTGKNDTADRLVQSDTIIAYLKTLKHSFILGGDFNLSPDTESLKKFEDFGLKNLIKEWKIMSTRTSFFTFENKFADYVFVSKGVNVLDFRVLPDEVSDHAPLCVKISA